MMEWTSFFAGVLALLVAQSAARTTPPSVFSYEGLTPPGYFPVYQPDLPPLKLKGPQRRPINLPCQRMMYQAIRLINAATNPNPLVWAYNSSLYNSLFDQNVKLRITPLGNFDGIKMVVGYFFTLTAYWIPFRDRVVEKMICSGNRVAWEATVINEALLSYPYTNTNTSMWAFMTFDPTTYLVTSIEATFLQLGYKFDTPYPDVVNPRNPDNMTYYQERIAVLCRGSVNGQLKGRPLIPGGTCQGSNAQWNNTLGLSQYDYCTHFLTNETPFGSWNNAWSNTVICRLIHVQLTFDEPDLHCSHIGPTGGGVCVDHSYNSWFVNSAGVVTY